MQRAGLAVLLVSVRKIAKSASEVHNREAAAGARAEQQQMKAVVYLYFSHFRGRNFPRRHFDSSARFKFLVFIHPWYALS